MYRLNNKTDAEEVMDQIPFMVNNRSKIPFINRMHIYAPVEKNNKV